MPLTILFVALLLLGAAISAHAGTIIARPMYIGLNDGLVGHWTFDGQTVSNNDTVADLSGNSNEVIRQGDKPKPVPGRIGQAFNFDGANTWFETASNVDALDGAAPMTVSAWIYPRSFGELSAGRIVDSNNAGVGGYIFRLNTSNQLSLQIGGGTVNSNTGAITLNSWQHITLVYDAVVARFFVNGVSVGAPALTTTIANSTTNFSIGARGDGAATFDGLIDDVRIYNRALTPAEVLQLYSLGR